MGTILCTRRISRCLEGECLVGFEGRGIFGSHQERVQRRGGRVSKSGRVVKRLE